MEWLVCVNEAMRYIEEHLAEEISYDKAARIARCSAYHFQRMFSYIAGVPLSEYVRRRRLTQAALELQRGGVKVIDVALKYGYESPEAFSRAFKRLHGVHPASARGVGVTLKAYPKMTFRIMLQGDVEMKYRIVEREAFRVFGVSTEISADMEEAFRQVPQFARECDDNHMVDEMNDLLGRFHDNYTISALYDYTETNFKYMLCNYLPKGLSVPGKFTVLDVPAATYAVFDVPGADAQAMWKRVWGEWFPASGYEAVPGPQFEMYYGLASHENGFAEIWVPVRKL